MNPKRSRTKVTQPLIEFIRKHKPTKPQRDPLLDIIYKNTTTEELKKTPHSENFVG